MVNVYLYRRERERMQLTLVFESGNKEEGKGSGGVNNCSRLHAEVEYIYVHVCVHHCEWYVVQPGDVVWDSFTSRSHKKNQRGCEGGSIYSTKGEMGYVWVVLSKNPPII